MTWTIVELSTYAYDVVWICNGRRTLRIVPLMCQWTLGIVDDWGERASGCGRAGRRGVTTASTPSRVVYLVTVTTKLDTDQGL